MNDERLLEDSDLKDAFRSVRDAYDGSHPEANATLQRALFRTRKQAKKQRLTRWVALPIAATLAASTAWAGMTGRLAPVVETVLETLRVEAAPVAATTAAPAGAPLAAKPAEKVEEPPAEPVAAAAEPTPEPAPAPEAAPVPAPAPAPPDPALSVRAPARELAGAPSLPRRYSRPTSKEEHPLAIAPAESSAAPGAPKPAADPQAALFAEAHRLHFIERDPARALTAWDQYLASAPSGRFAPEARYNRALALVRLGRTSEAKTELDAFARGTYGSYRQAEAKALLEALARDGR